MLLSEFRRIHPAEERKSEPNQERMREREPERGQSVELPTRLPQTAEAYRSPLVATLDYKSLGNIKSRGKIKNINIVFLVLNILYFYI